MTIEIDACLFEASIAGLGDWVNVVEHVEEAPPGFKEIPVNCEVPHHFGIHIDL